MTNLLGAVHVASQLGVIRPLNSKLNSHCGTAFTTYAGLDNQRQQLTEPELPQLLCCSSTLLVQQFEKQ
jgi:hypothetical protein